MSNKLKSRTSSNRRPQALCEPAPKKLTAGSKAQLRATSLLAIEMRFIPASDFESLEGDTTPIEMAIDLMESLRKQSIENRQTVTAGLDLDERPVLRDWNSDAPAWSTHRPASPTLCLEVSHDLATLSISRTVTRIR